MIDPNPRQRAKGDLERARPVDSPQIWIGREPALDLAFDLENVLPAPIQPEGLGENDEVLMPVELPDCFMIAGARAIEIGNEPEIAQAAGNSGAVVTAPVDGCSGIESGIEQGKMVSQNFGGQVLEVRMVGSAS